MCSKCDDRGEILPNGNLSEIRTEFGLNQLIPTKCSSVEIFGYAQCRPIEGPNAEYRARTATFTRPPDLGVQPCPHDLDIIGDLLPITFYY